MRKDIFGEISLSKKELEKIGSEYPIKLEYYRVENEIKDEYKMNYGIEVVKKINLEGELDIEAKRIKNVCNCEYLTNNILEKLRNCKVMPCNLEDVTEDLMKEYGIA